MSYQENMERSGGVRSLQVIPLQIEVDSLQVISSLAKYLVWLQTSNVLSLQKRALKNVSYCLLFYGVYQPCNCY